MRWKLYSSAFQKQTYLVNSDQEAIDYASFSALKALQSNRFVMSDMIVTAETSCLFTLKRGSLVECLGMKLLLVEMEATKFESLRRACERHQTDPGAQND